MARWKAEVTVAALDVARLTQVQSLVLARLRGIEFVSEVANHPVTGERIGGLRVVKGAHPQPGTRYDVTLDDEPTRERARQAAIALEEGREVHVPGIGALRPDDPRTRALIDGVRASAGDSRPNRHTAIELEADRPDLIRLSGQDVNTGETAPMAWTIELTRPNHPETLRTSTRFESGRPTRLTRGQLTTECELHVDRLPGGSRTDDRPSAHITLGHPRFRARADLDVETTADGTWRVRIDATGAGRGLLRPLAGAAWLLAGRRVRRTLNARFAQLPTLVDRANASVAGDAEEIATRAITHLLDRVDRVG